MLLIPLEGHGEITHLELGGILKGETVEQFLVFAAPVHIVLMALKVFCVLQRPEV